MIRALAPLALVLAALAGPVLAQAQAQPQSQSQSQSRAVSADEQIGIDTLARIRAMVRNSPDLRAKARAATPPSAGPGTRTPDLVALTGIDPTLKLDIRYATSNNFMGFPVYERPGAYLQRPAAEALKRVNARVRAQGYGLLIHDGYRPWYVTKMFWDATPAEGKDYVADPSKGSRHNRGSAIDLTLFDLKTGEAVVMPGGYDEMSPRSHPDYAGGTAEQRRLRDLLRDAMLAEGFMGYPTEWWHFDYKDWEQYPIENLSFDEIDARAGG